MISLGVEYQCRVNLNLYNSPQCQGLATQAAKYRHLQALESGETAWKIQLCEDDYCCWLAIADFEALEPATTPYQAVSLAYPEIQDRIPGAIAFTLAALNHPNQYLWGGTVAPDYDCSGLMQAAFAAVGVWLPRDSYQQESFTQPIDWSELQPGDLIFFGTSEKTDHVALYLGNGEYIHSSGPKQGRNGIAIDPLFGEKDEINKHYTQRLRRAGRITRSYQPGMGW